MDLDRFFSRVNPLVAGLLRSPLHPLLSRGLVLLTITGRRSGRRYAIPVGYQRDGDGLVVLVSKARRKQWWRNFLEPGPVELRLRGRTLHGVAAVVPPGTEDFRRCTERTFRRLPGLGRQFDIHYERGAGLSDAQLAHLGREAAVVRVALENPER